MTALVPGTRKGVTPDPTEYPPVRARDYHEGDIVVAENYRRGKANPRRIGDRVGWVIARVSGNGRPNPSGMLSRVSIRSCGPIRIGLTEYCVCVAESMQAVYLAREGKVWRFPGVRLKTPAPSLNCLEADQRAAYADVVARVLASRVTPQPEQELVAAASQHYRDSVRKLVSQRVSESVSSGFPRSVADFAKGVCDTWEAVDLLKPRYPSVHHAIVTALVLALPVKHAAELIELAGIIEYRMPFLTNQAAGLMYQEAAHLLSVLSPEWRMRRHLCDWGELSIDRLWRWDFANRLHQASARQIPLASVGRSRSLVPTGDEEYPDNSAETLEIGADLLLGEDEMLSPRQIPDPTRELEEDEQEAAQWGDKSGRR